MLYDSSFWKIKHFSAKNTKKQRKTTKIHQNQLYFSLFFTFYFCLLLLCTLSSYALRLCPYCLLYSVFWIFQSKTLTVKNKNKIFPKFLSPYYTLIYKNPASKNAQIFDSKLHTRLIIEAGFFSPAPTFRMSPAPLFRVPCTLRGCILWGAQIRESRRSPVLWRSQYWRETEKP